MKSQHNQMEKLSELVGQTSQQIMIEMQLPVCVWYD